MTNPETQDRGGWDFGSQFPRTFPTPISKEFLLPVLTLIKKQCPLGVGRVVETSPQAVLLLPRCVSLLTVAGWVIQSRCWEQFLPFLLAPLFSQPALPEM